MRVYSCSFECTREVYVHARTYIFRKKRTRAHAKIASKSQILEKYSVIPRKRLAKARVSLRACVKLNLSCTVGDEHINAANQLLRSQFPDIQGLHSPLLEQRFCFTTFDIVKGYAGYPYIQVMHTGKDHWVTIEIVSEDEVRIFDSLF